MDKHAFSMEEMSTGTDGFMAHALHLDGAAALDDSFHWHRIRRMSRK